MLNVLNTIQQIILLYSLIGTKAYNVIDKPTPYTYQQIVKTQGLKRYKYTTVFSGIEEVYIVKNCYDSTVKELAAYCKTTEEIMSKHLEELERMKKTWTDEQLAILKTKYPKIGAKVAIECGHSESQVRQKAHALGIKFEHENVNKTPIEKPTEKFPIDTLHEMQQKRIEKKIKETEEVKSVKEDKWCEILEMAKKMPHTHVSVTKLSELLDAYITYNDLVTELGLY